MSELGEAVPYVPHVYREVKETENLANFRQGATRIGVFQFVEPLKIDILSRREALALGELNVHLVRAVAAAMRGNRPASADRDNFVVPSTGIEIFSNVRGYRRYVAIGMEGHELEVERAHFVNQIAQETGFQPVNFKNFKWSVLYGKLPPRTPKYKELDYQKRLSRIRPKVLVFGPLKIEGDTDKA